MSVLVRSAFWLVLGAGCSSVATCGQKGPLELPEGGDQTSFGRDAIAGVEPCMPPVDHERKQAALRRPVHHVVRA